MKKNFIYGMLVALGVAAFASCTTDDTLDSVKIPLSGKTKTIIVAPAIDQTRTELGEEHTLLWSEGDKFGVLAAKGTTILANVPSDPYSVNKEADQYEKITVPAETDHIYCYYPYTKENDALAQKEISEFTFTLPSKISHETLENANYQGEFLSQYHFMVADSEVTDNENLVFAKFKPVVSIAEFVIYDTEDGSDNLKSLAFASGSYIAGTFGVDFAAATLNAEAKEQTGATQVDIAFSEDSYLSIPKTADDARKTPVYLTVPKGEHYNATLTLSTEKHPDEGYFDQLKWSKTLDLKADGKTVLVNMKHAKPMPMVEIMPISVHNPYYISAPVKVYQSCGFIAVYAYPTDSYNESTFRSTVEEIYNNYKNNKLGDYYYVPLKCAFWDGYYDMRDGSDDWDWGTEGGKNYMIIPVEGDAVHYDGYLKTKTGDYYNYTDSNNKAFAANTDYTYAVYAVSEGQDPQHPEPEVYTATFRTPAVTITNGDDSHYLHIDVATQGITATATVTGAGIKQIVTWVGNTGIGKDLIPEAVNGSATEERNITPKVLASVMGSGNRFQSFASGMTFVQEDMNSLYDYYLCAVGISENNEIVAANWVKANAPELEIGSSEYKITGVELAKNPTKVNDVHLKFTVTGDAKYLRVLGQLWRNVDGQKADPSIQGGEERKAWTMPELKEMMMNSTKNKTYLSFPIENGECIVDLPFGADETENKEGDVAMGHNPFYIFVVAADEDGGLTGELGKIYQITGEYDNPTANELDNDYIHGATLVPVPKQGENASGTYDQWQPTNVAAYYYTCPQDKFEEPEPEVNTNIWSSRTAFTFGAWYYAASQDVAFYASAAYASTYGRVWIIKLGKDEETAELFSNTYNNTPTIRATLWPKVQPLFSEYATTGLPNDGVTILRTYDSKSLPTSFGTTDRTSLTPEIGDIYVAVAEDLEGKTLEDGKYPLILGYFGVYNQNGAPKFPTSAVLQLNN